MGEERKWKLNNGQLKLEEVKYYGYVIDFFSSLKVYNFSVCSTAIYCNILDTVVDMQLS